MFVCEEKTIGPAYKAGNFDDIWVLCNGNW